MEANVLIQRFELFGKNSPIAIKNAIICVDIIISEFWGFEATEDKIKDYKILKRQLLKIQKTPPPINFYDFHKSEFTNDKILVEIKKLPKADILAWVQYNDKNFDADGFIKKDYLIEVMYNAIIN
jgi:hypothetical protein